MTLVYGMATKDIGFLVADTLVSFDDDRNGRTGLFNGKDHVLKIQILNSATAIAFAGDVESALKMIHRIGVELNVNSDVDVPEHLFEVYKEYVEEVKDHRLDDCEFLVLLIRKKEKKLARVTKDKCVYCERGYIGSSIEYGNIMQLRCTPEIPKTQSTQQADGSFLTGPLIASQGEIEFYEISDAMESLTQELKSNAVGAICGWITRVVDARHSGGLEYLQSGESSNTPEEGLSGYSYLASNAGVRGIGIYWRIGKVGFLFIVGDAVSSRKVGAATLSDFINVAKQRYGLELAGVGWGEG